MDDVRTPLINLLTGQGLPDAVSAQRPRLPCSHSSPCGLTTARGGEGAGPSELLCSCHPASRGIDEIASRYSLRSLGFTLIELLVAMMILVIVSTAAVVIFRGVTKAWRSGELRTERYQQARLLYDLFTRELVSSVVDPRYPFLGTENEPLHEGSMADELFFVTALPGRDGLVERGYWMSADEGLMCHDESPPDGDPSTGVSEPCGHDVTQFDVSFFNGTEWVEAWDGRSTGAQRGQVPTAVRIVMTVGRKVTERFETIIRLPTSQ